MIAVREAVRGRRWLWTEEVENENIEAKHVAQTPPFPLPSLPLSRTVFSFVCIHIRSISVDNVRDVYLWFDEDY